MRAMPSSVPAGQLSTAAPLLQSQNPRTFADDSAGVSGHSLGMTADQIRRLMNQRSSNDMSEGRVLKDRKPTWQILNNPSQNSSQTNTETAGTEITPGVSNGSANISGTQAAVRTVSKPRESTAATPGPEGSAGSPEPTMLDRLRGFYGPTVEADAPATEENTRQRLMRQIQRLPSPWSVFRDREETEPTAPATELDFTQNQTAESSVTTVQEAPDTNPLLLQLIAAMQQELESWPRLPGGTFQDPETYQRRQQDLRLLYLIANQSGAAIAAVESLPPGEQDFWQEMMLGLAHYRTTDRDSSREERLASTVSQLRSAVRRLTPLTALQIKRIDLCSQIYSFGRIETFPSNSFDPGQPILLYVEVENFATRLTPTGSYETNFDAQLQFFEESNEKPIETVELPNISDEATSERMDYYQSFELNVPSHLESGRYFIRLRLRDRNSGKVAQDIAEFQVQ